MLVKFHLESIKEVRTHVSVNFNNLKQNTDSKICIRNVHGHVCLMHFPNENNNKKRPPVLFLRASIVQYDSKPHLGVTNNRRVEIKSQVTEAGSNLV